MRANDFTLLTESEIKSVTEGITQDLKSEISVLVQNATQNEATAIRTKVVPMLAQKLKAWAVKKLNEKNNDNLEDVYDNTIVLQKIVNNPLGVATQLFTNLLQRVPA